MNTTRYPTQAAGSLALPGDGDVTGAASTPWYLVPKRRNWSACLAVLLVALCALIPFLSTNLLLYSIANQVLVAVPATLSVYLMLRMDLISFAVPAFMCIGGYGAALCALNFSTNILLLTAISFIAPMLVALPLGALVLRLRGVYFVLVTYVLSEIVQLLLIELADFTGGSNGLAGIPATTFLSWSFVDNRAVLFIAVALALLATLIAFATTSRYRKQFDAIRENELLAKSLGLVVWRYKALGFAIAAGLAGLAGFSLVNMLLTAHPSSFLASSGVNYISFAYIGGQASLLGPIIGTGLLVWAANYFSVGGEYSQGFFGLLVIVIVLAAPGGIVGLVSRLVSRLLKARTGKAGDAGDAGNAGSRSSAHAGVQASTRQPKQEVTLPGGKR